MILPKTEGFRPSDAAEYGVLPVTFEDIWLPRKLFGVQKGAFWYTNLHQCTKLVPPITPFVTSLKMRMLDHAA